MAEITVGNFGIVYQLTYVIVETYSRLFIGYYNVFFYFANHTLTLFTDIAHHWSLQSLHHLGHLKID